MNDRCAGDVELLEKLGRNDPCPCGSGRRYKRCCLKSGKFDGSLRDHYFQRAPVIRRSYCFCRPFFLQPNVTPMMFSFVMISVEMSLI
ncbi:MULTISPECIES: SEC-C metal-binding domain-containing protein [Stappiaceae]|uniref:SEC-C metal-binding domain-containing protein n=1 Tax=Stappiaceae TaxID=2821832 RepID=UPI0018C9EB5B